MGRPYQLRTAFGAGARDPEWGSRAVASRPRTPPTRPERSDRYGLGRLLGHSLAVESWTGLGRRAGTKGYEYTDERRANGPSTSVRMEPEKKIDAACTGPRFAFTLNEPARDVQSRDGKTGRFEAEDAPPPESCPVP